MYYGLVKSVNAIHVIGVSKLVKKTDYNKKLEETEKKLPGHNRYIATDNFNKFSVTIFEEKLK